MRRVRAIDKADGTPAGLIEAASITEATRRAYDYECRYAGCSCKMHWRKAVHGKGNTEQHSPTFAKNPSSSHVAGCPGDLEAIQRENVEYTTIRNGRIHIRINFPIGSAFSDRYPQKGFLGKEFIDAARAQRDILPFGTLGNLVKFFEKNFGGIETDEAADVVVCYQGQEAEWGKLFKGSDAYAKLSQRSLNHKYRGRDEYTSPVITVLKPLKELEPTARGNKKFLCEAQQVVMNRSGQRIHPVVVCDKRSPDLEFKIRTLMEEGSAMLISARPFQPLNGSKGGKAGEQHITMFVHSIDQIAKAEEKYWHPSMVPSPQKDFFGKQDMVRSPHAR